MIDANKQAIAYVYGHPDKRDAEIAGSPIASNIAKLPKLLGKG